MALEASVACSRQGTSREPVLARLRVSGRAPNATDIEAQPAKRPNHIGRNNLDHFQTPLKDISASRLVHSLPVPGSSCSTLHQSLQSVLLPTVNSPLITRRPAGPCRSLHPSCPVYEIRRRHISEVSDYCLQDDTGPCGVLTSSVTAALVETNQPYLQACLFQV